MRIVGVLYQGPEERDASVIDGLPAPLKAILLGVNGFVAFGGALHLRGACDEPSWHSLKRANELLRQLYPSLLEDGDVAFAEDCLGDQALVRDDRVFWLRAETGQVEDTELTLTEWLAAVEKDPERELSPAPLTELPSPIEPGQLIRVDPSFAVFAEDRAYRAMPADEVLRHHAKIAERVRALPAGVPPEPKDLEGL